MSNFRYPNITERDPARQLAQVKSYLIQLTDQLNAAMDQLPSTEGGAVYQGKGYGGSGAPGQISPQVNFNDLKSLIIKSADIVNAYYDIISKRLEGEYVARSEFGTFAEQTAQQIEANSTAIEQQYAHIQQILSDLEGLEHSLIEVNAHIKTGLLYYDAQGIPVYGLEIGQKSSLDGVEVFNKFAQFTSEKLSFYDSNDNEVAYISDRKLFIGHVEVTGSFVQGGFADETQPDGSIITRWAGTGG